MRYPFRIFANQNLGVHYDYSELTGEWLPSASTGQFPVLPEINIATGNCILKSILIKTREQTGYFELGFVYNTQNESPWTWNIPAIINSTVTQIIFQESDGSRIIYAWNTTQNAYVSPSGGHAHFSVIKNSDGSFLKTDPKTGIQTLFSAAGKIQTVYDARGFQIHYYYDEHDNIQTITTAAGIYAINNESSVVSVTFKDTLDDTTTLLAIWHFDSENYLQTATLPDPNNYCLNYYYDSETNLLARIEQTDGTSLQFQFVDRQLSTLQQGTSGARYQFSYGENQTVFTDALMFTKTASFNKNSCITTWCEQVGDTIDSVTTQTTLCAYYSNGDIQLIIKPDGGQRNFIFSTNGLLFRQTDSNNQVTEYDYSTTEQLHTLTCCEVLQNILASCLRDISSVALSVRESNVPPLLLNKRALISGNLDDKTAVWAVERYVYQTITAENFTCRLLRFIILPSGSVTEFRYNENNQLTSERTYLNNIYDLSSLLPQQSISYDVMTSWVLTVPAGVISLKTMTENNRGLRTESRVYTQIQTDGTGFDSRSASEQQFQNHTIWGEAQKRIEKVDTDIYAITTTTFDGLHRLTAEQNALSQSKMIAYNDAKQNYVITEANLRTEMRLWDSSGNTISVTTKITSSDAVRIKLITYDLAGRVASIQNSDRQVTYYLFDSLNRLRFSITPMGRVIEHRYDDVNRYRAKIKYANSISMGSCQELPPTFEWLNTQLMPDGKKDVTTYEIRDTSKRSQFIVNGRGAVMEYRYDFRNNIIAKIQYAAQITSAEITAIQNGSFTRIPDSTDNIDSINYDIDCHVVTTQDGDGYVTTHQRNAAGHEIYQKKYATKTVVNIDSLICIPTASVEDFGQYLLCDAKG